MAKKNTAKAPAKAPDVEEEAASETEAVEAESELDDEESELEEEDLDPEIEALLSFAQMDSEAAAAYDIAAESMSEARVAQLLRSFAEDHRRHVADIRKLIQGLGTEIELASPDPETSTFATMAATVGQLGMSAGLRTLIASEQFTNSSYETALELIAEPEARAVVERNFRDEQRHIQALMQELQRSQREDEREAG
jgi:rubrerythrin